MRAHHSLGFRIMVPEPLHRLQYVGLVVPPERDIMLHGSEMTLKESVPGPE